MLKFPISRDSYTFIANSISLVTYKIRSKLASIMFIYDLVNLNISCPELLSQVEWHILVNFVRRLTLLFVPKFTTILAAGHFTLERFL